MQAMSVLLALLALAIPMTSCTSANTCSRALWLVTQDDTKTWTFVFSNDGFPANYINETTKVLEGQSVDLAKAVCALAKKKCVMLVSPRSDCWNDQLVPAKSKVLDTKQEDVCANLVESPDRNSNHQVPPQPIYKIPDPEMIAAANSSIELDDLKTCNNLKLAFAKLTAANRQCVLNAGLFIKEENEVPVLASSSIVQAMLEVAGNVTAGKADVGLIIPRFFDVSKHPEVKSLGTVKCLSTLIGLNMMVRKDNTEFIKWWQPTLKWFMCCRELYDRFCKKMEDKYGVDPLCFKSSEIDCSSPSTGLPPPDPGMIIDPCA